MSEFTLRHVPRITLGVGIAASLMVYFLRGPTPALGLLIGAAISALNYAWFRSLAEALGDSGTPPARGSTMFLVGRYVVAAAAIYVIVAFTSITLGAVLVGLLANVAAILLEVLYELVSKN